MAVERAHECVAEEPGEPLARAKPLPRRLPVAGTPPELVPARMINREEAGVRQSYIVSYDVCDPKRLRKIFKAMRGYGDWLQLSVWQCDLSRRELVELRRDLGQIIDSKVDQVLIIDIGPANGRGLGAIASLGRAYVPSERVAVVV